MLVDLVIGVVERKAPIETSKIGWGVVLDAKPAACPHYHGARNLDSPSFSP